MIDLSTYESTINFLEFELPYNIYEKYFGFYSPPALIVKDGSLERLITYTLFILECENL